MRSPTSTDPSQTGLVGQMEAISAVFDQNILTHLDGVSVETLSRVPLERVRQRALPHIGLIELVSAEAFSELYDGLYRAMFHGGERERSELIVQRLQEEFAGNRKHLAPYRIIGIRDRHGQAIAAAQFSVLFLSDGWHAAPYLQYIYTRPENRRQDMSELLHTLVLAVTAADVRERSRQTDGQECTIPFTFFETEPACHGAEEANRAVAAQRTQIHSKSGSLALMLQRKRDQAYISAHVQPGLDNGEPPITLIWALRANPAAKLVLAGNEMGHALLAAYYQSLRDEGFPEQNIVVAEQVVRERCREECDFCLIPLGDVTKEMYVGIDR